MLCLMTLFLKIRYPNEHCFHSVDLLEGYLFKEKGEVNESRGMHINDIPKYYYST